MHRRAYRNLEYPGAASRADELRERLDGVVPDIRRRSDDGVILAGAASVEEAVSAEDGSSGGEFVVGGVEVDGFGCGCERGGYRDLLEAVFADLVVRRLLAELLVERLRLAMRRGREERGQRRLLGFFFDDSRIHMR